MAHQEDDWIETFTGKHFHFPVPADDDFCIEDIAHGLAFTCRYSGHCKRFYSVAEHSVLLSRYEDERIDAADIRRELLMHDAQEAYLTDVPRPLKQYLADYKTIEARLEKSIERIFNLVMPQPLVKEFDSRILVTEAPQLGLHVSEWCDYYKQLKPLDIKLEMWPPDVAEEEFLTRFYELYY